MDKKIIQFDLEGELLLRFETAFKESGFQSRSEFMRHMVIMYTQGGRE